MKISYFVYKVAGIFLFSALIPIAFADQITAPGITCQAYNAASANLLVSSGNGWKNTSVTNSALLVCPVVANLDRLNGDSLRVGVYKSGSAFLPCTVVRQRAYGTENIVSQSFYANGNSGEYSLVVPSVASAAGRNNDSIVIHCALPPNSILRSYWWQQ